MKFNKITDKRPEASGLLSVILLNFIICICNEIHLKIFQSNEILFKKMNIVFFSLLI